MFEAIQALITELRKADPDRHDAILAELTELCSAAEGSTAREHIGRLMKGEVLTIQWDLEEIIEATAPKRRPPPEEPKEAEPKEPEPPPPPDPNQPLSQADVKLVYDDPRGLMLHRTHDGKRWLATQVDPRTGQPQTFELHSSEIAQIKRQLQGSPYWVLGG